MDWLPGDAARKHLCHSFHPVRVPYQENDKDAEAQLSTKRSRRLGVVPPSQSPSNKLQNSVEDGTSAGVVMANRQRTNSSTKTDLLRWLSGTVQEWVVASRHDSDGFFTSCQGVNKGQ